MDRNDKFMRLYSETVFIFDKKLVLPQAFAIVTAHNPTGEISGTKINNTYDASLREALAKSGEVKSYQPMLGCSADLCHREQSYAIETSKAFAFDFSLQFRQNAFFWVEQDRLIIVPVLLQRVSEINIGTFSSRLK